MTGQATPFPLGAIELAELHTRHGALTDDTAVYGTTLAATEPVPNWIAEPSDVHRRLRRKNHSGLGALTWCAVAVLAARCHTLLRPRTPGNQPSPATLDDAISLAAFLARRLPAPPRPLLTRAAAPPVSDRYTAACGPPTGAVEAAATRLCRALDDPGWTSPDELAGWIADAHTALTRHRNTTPRPTAPAPRVSQPAEHRRPPGPNHPTRRASVGCRQPATSR